MADKGIKIQEFVDGIASSVAFVQRNDDDVDLTVAACNDSFFQMLGGRNRSLSFPFPLDALLPSYSRRELRAKIHECFSTGLAQELEQAYDLRDGTHWWRLSLKPFRHDGSDGGDAISGILLTGLDITTKVQLHRALEVSTSRFRSVVDAAYDAIVTVDQQQRITLFNRAAEHLFGYEQAQMLGQPLEALIPEQHREHHGDYVHQFARSPVKSREMNERNRIYGQHQDGTRIPVEIAISKINVDGGVEFTAVVRDITDRVHLMDVLQKQAASDALTGLPNRRDFALRAAELMKSTKPFSVLMLDVDHFKRVNDSHGHDIGDEVLRLLARVGAATVRHRDIFARLGGEEFVVALPDTDAAQALNMGERLRAVFEEQDFDHDWKSGQPVPFTVSIGVATRVDGETDLEALLKRADQALYRAKGAGRNRVEAG
ncbi:diguanylate cyclase [Methyloversatilis sp.]|uniref:sensor domain-containing diguanylate cyclase n=1 Tax=Methyloversatilis sp. TaxID=2569862 RepID=UPI0027353DC4|nr:diguanylate cyclase [Methyloversatilis sp.]MDP2870489.1 diguanylate cyclase [Methyloversatilis sp.]MDP3457442.1 diguanylate cyclase [Methyloversatilis sp.]MDP3576515.1 diguanylate cyclase [Methyloversatilis sp.]